MADKPWSVAFAGTGDTSENNVKGLLDDWLPQELEHITLPERIGRSHKGLKNVKAWLDEEIGEDDLSSAPVAELLDVLLEHRNKGADAYLVYVPAEEWDEESEAAQLVRACIESGIPVKDLTAGLDDFVPPELPSEYDKTGDAPKPPADEAPVTTTRRRGKPRGESFDPKTEPERIAAAQAAVAASQPAADDDPPFDTQEAPAAPVALAGGGVTVNLSPATIQALLALAGALSEDIKASVVAGLPDSAKPKVVKYPFWVNEDGEYRPRTGRGRPKNGEQKADLTAEECAQLGLDLPE